jgi:hypothetical protein
VSRPSARGDLPKHWRWLSLIPLGLGAWAPCYAGLRWGKWRLFLIGAAWSLVTAAGWVFAVTSGGDALSGALILLGWGGGACSSFAARDPDMRTLDGAPFVVAMADAEQRLRERDRARKLARDRPELAREMGVGRPDLTGAPHGGLVDVNNAPAATLMTLPGIDQPLAAKIVQARREMRCFASVEDLGAEFDLDPYLVERLRDRTVFLPI